MAYFNKSDFYTLIGLWRKVVKDSDDDLIKKCLAKDNDFLMKSFLPIKFIGDIKKELKEKGVISNEISI